MKKFSKGNSCAGLMFGLDGEIIQLSKYAKNWHQIFKKHNLNEKYKTNENFEHFCYLNYMCIDAESVLVEKIMEIENKIKYK